MTESLKKFTISSIPEIWYLARDMCEPKIQSYIRRVTLKLLIECIKNDDLTSTSTKLMYFRDIVAFCQLSEFKTDQEFDLFLNALRNLTQDGRDIQELYIYEGFSSLPQFLVTALAALGRLAKNYTEKSTEKELEEDVNYQNIIKLLAFIKNCIKFNPYAFDDSFTINISKKAIHIASRTTNNNILVHCIELLSTTVIFTTIPQAQLFEVIAYMCSVFGSNEKSTRMVWDAITILASHSSFYLLRNCLIEILTNEALSTFKTTESENALSAVKSNTTISTIEHKPSNSALSSCVGAIQIIERLAVSPSVSKSSDSLLVHFLPALVEMSSLNVPALNTTILRSLDRLFSKNSYSTLSEANVNAMEHVYSFQLWYSSKTSIYELLTNIKILSEIDVSYWKSICMSLQHAHEAHELYTPKERLVNLFTRNHQYLPNETIKYVLKYYSEEKWLTVLNPFAQENTFKLLNYFYFTNGSHPGSDLVSAEDSSDIKVEVLKCIKGSFDISYAISKSEFNFEIVVDILKRSLNEKDEKVLDYLINEIFVKAVMKAPFQTLSQIVDEIVPYFDVRYNGRLRSLVSIESSALKTHSSNSMDTAIPGKISKPFKLAITKGFIKLLIIESTEDAEKASETFRTCILMAKHALSIEDSELLLVVLKGEKLQMDLEVWFSIVLDIMTHFIEWEVYSFVWAHFCPQLSNMKLFANSREQILSLKKVVCDQLLLNLPSNIKFPEGFTKSHLQVAYVRVFSSLIGYHRLFSKHDEDDIIRALVFGIDSWEKTAIPSIHILTACCYEIPLSIKKYLSTILAKLQTKVTSVFVSSHILEFLMSLINIPSLTASLDIDDVKRIFGISFKFVQYATDAIKNTGSTEDKGLVPQHGLDAEIDNTPSTQRFQEHASVLLQYVLTLSYNVISTWFLKLEISVRGKLSSFILKNLVAINSNNKELDDQVIAYVDLITRFTYSNLPLKMVNPKAALDQLKSEEGTVAIKSWITGSVIVTIGTNSDTGKSTVVFRRPTGATILQMALDERMLSSKSKLSKSQTLSPNFLLLQTFNHIDGDHKYRPIPLMDDAVTTRAITTLDRIPIVEFHKIGLVYIGRGQIKEKEVLANRGGSKSYQKFVDAMGDLIKLKNCKDIYVGGLDTENGTDGDFAISWSDKTVQVVYHTTSLMPNPDEDIYFEHKKRHIGNNYVNIYFDESGHPFNFNLIKSQFNFINIVISPHTKSFHTYNKEPIEETTRLFKIKLLRRSGVPGVFATCHFKIFSEDVLPAVVRNLAITANQFASVWHANYHGQFVSNWTHRVKSIKVLKERTIQSHEALKQEQLNQEDSKLGVNDATQSFLEQLQFGTVSSTIESSHRYEYVKDSDNELYSVVEFNSFA
ncbi:hypothetical protein CANTEDRAFT_134045 [Yamadazyma tenuis ATCC 10573]|uniref:Rap-GAP domain-containing protein n=1 Tax=Candida tenuis (strain ATCC 10573 / BCRC 21748 / CBS 615 / JCM 9827 / NBRC 10315 / NRRL Y-1498 / VKM Y-70) TaxID=590646 RepID=G3B2Q3_CANTC|nr:uncharacterized protein CANTEDRAFT_134045 [Yamadazyma tenuis ATCC 10573]EGV64731.1 hypothetical protein CANTEDRAFT_134045 [Yamadazyma tenuis ATCC 10573]